MGNFITKIVDRVRGRTRQTPRKKLTAQERLKKKREAEIRSLIGEVSFYLVFLILLVITAFNNRDGRAFRYRVSILDSLDKGHIVSKIRSPANMWNWTQKVFLPFLYRATDWRGRTVTLGHSKLVSSLASYRLGPLRLRQHRLRNESCSVPDGFVRKNIRCVPSWSSDDRDWDDYGPGWTTRNNSSPFRNRSSQAVPSNNEIQTSVGSAWTYKGWSSIGGLPITASLGIYPPGGYVLDIEGSEEDAMKSVKHLQDNDWMDDKTKVVLMEVTLYCPNVNLFTMITVIFEFPQSEVLMGNIHIHPFRLFTYLGNYPVAMIVCDYLVYIAIVWFALREFQQMRERKLQYFKEIWNLLEIVNLMTSITAVVLYIGRQYISDDVSKEATKSSGQFYNFQTLAMWDELFGYLVAFVCFLSTLQVLHLLRFNRRMSILGATMLKSAKDLSSFAFVFILMFLAFLSFSYVTFGPFLKSYKSIIDAGEALLLVALGHLEYKTLNAVNRIFTPLFIFLYMMFIVFILINMLISILMESFAAVRDDVSKQPNDYELIDYIIATTTTFFWKFNPFRGMWKMACKIGLVTDMQPDSIKTANSGKNAKEKVLSEPGGKTNENPEGPIIYIGPKNRCQARFLKNLLKLHLRLDLLLENITKMLPNEIPAEIHQERKFVKREKFGSKQKRGVNRKRQMERIEEELDTVKSMDWPDRKETLKENDGWIVGNEKEELTEAESFAKGPGDIQADYHVNHNSNAVIEMNDVDENARNDMGEDIEANDMSRKVDLKLSTPIKKCVPRGFFRSGREKQASLLTLDQDIFMSDNLLDTSLDRNPSLSPSDHAVPDLCPTFPIHVDDPNTSPISVVPVMGNIASVQLHSKPELKSQAEIMNEIWRNGNYSDDNVEIGLTNPEKIARIDDQLGLAVINENYNNVLQEQEDDRCIIQTPL